MTDGPDEPIDERSLTRDLHVEATYRLTEALVASENRMRRRIDLLSEVVFEADETGALVCALDADLSPTEIKQLVVQFTQSGKSLGSLQVNGPFDPAKTEGKLNVAISSIDRQVLNLAGAAAGIDFGSTTITSTNRIEIAQAGKVVLLNGRLAANTLSVADRKSTRLNSSHRT